MGTVGGVYNTTDHIWDHLARDNVPLSVNIDTHNLTEIYIRGYFNIFNIPEIDKVWLVYAAATRYVQIFIHNRMRALERGKGRAKPLTKLWMRLTSFDRTYWFQPSKQHLSPDLYFYAGKYLTSERWFISHNVLGSKNSHYGQILAPLGLGGICLGATSLTIVLVVYHWLEYHSRDSLSELIIFA